MTNIIERKKPIKASQINLTNHGFERYLLRVGLNKSREYAEQWVARALNNSTYLRTQDNGCEEYSFDNFTIIVDKFLNIVTIKMADEDWKSINEVQSDITRYITNKLKKEAHPHVQAKKNFTIKIYEAKVKQIKAKSPKVKDIIQKQIDDLEHQLCLHNDKLEGIKKKVKKYYLDPSDIIKEVI